MRDDQLKRLEDLGENLMEVLLEDADPANWPGSDVPASDMTAEQRGNRNWTLKNANQVGALTARVLDLRERLIAGVKPPDQKPEDDPEQDISRYERVAKEMLKKASERQK